MLRGSTGKNSQVFQFTHDKENRSILKNRQPGYLFTFLTLVLCAFLISWSIDIYRITFISWEAIALFSLCGAIIFLLLFFKRFSRLGDSIIVIILSALYYGGSATTFFVLFTNKSLTLKSVTQRNEFQILKKGELFIKGKGCKEKYVVIEFNGLRKQLIFGCDYKEAIANSGRIEIEYKKGLLGFYTVCNIVFTKTAYNNKVLDQRGRANCYPL